MKTLKDLKPSEYNPRSIEEKALNGLKTSIESFGDLSGITFNKKTGNLVSGHQRVRALREKYGYYCGCAEETFKSVKDSFRDLENEAFGMFSTLSVQNQPGLTVKAVEEAVSQIEKTQATPKMITVFCFWGKCV